MRCIRPQRSAMRSNSVARRGDKVLCEVRNAAFIVSERSKVKIVRLAVPGAVRWERSSRREFCCYCRSNGPGRLLWCQQSSFTLRVAC